MARSLPESKRYERPHRSAPLRGHGRRLAMLAGVGFLLSLWGAPVTQFQNDYLKALIDLGEKDAIAAGDAIQRFLDRPVMEIV